MEKAPEATRLPLAHGEPAMQEILPPEGRTIGQRGPGTGREFCRPRRPQAARREYA